MIKFVSSLGVFRGAKLVKTAAILAAKTACTPLGIESNWAWMTETGNSLHAASSLCYTNRISWRGMAGQSLSKP